MLVAEGDDLRGSIFLYFGGDLPDPGKDRGPAVLVQAPYPNCHPVSYDLTASLIGLMEKLIYNWLKWIKRGEEGASVVIFRSVLPVSS